MHPSKGFSLIEVLLSLMLTSTIALALLQVMGQSRFFLNQLIIRTQASSILDQLDERLLISTTHELKPPQPFHVTIQKSKKQLITRLDCLNQMNSISRSYSLLEVKR